MSIGTRSAIVATFITTLIIPVVDSAHHLVGHAWKAGGSKPASCVPGQPVTLDGKTFSCQSKIVNTVKIAPKVTLCPKSLWWLNGKCVSRDKYLQSHSSSTSH
jgi:hypothetical protein